MFFCGSHKGETTTRDEHMKGTGAREGVGAGGLCASGRSDPQGFSPGRWWARPVVPTNSATLGQVDRVWPRGCPVLSHGALARRAAALQAAGHRFESHRFHATSSRALHKTGALAATCFFGEKMITRQDKRRVLEALDERLLMELVINPVDALCDTWEYGHYRTFRRLAWASDWRWP